MDVVTISFLIVMGLLFLVSLPAQFARSPGDGSISRWAAFGVAAPNLLTTMGVFGTFVGILLGLQGFDVTRVDESVPQLLDGLKTAFWTSAAGLGGAIILRLLQPLSGRSSSAASNDPVDILRSIETKIAAQTKALSGGEDTSLLTQLQKLRTSLVDASEAQKKSTDDGFQKQLEAFEAFAAKIAENNSKALIEALREVIRDFNAKINEQFGENFKHLNEAVGKLLEWQERYKAFVEQSEKSLRDATLSLGESATKLSQASQAMERLPQQAEEISKIVKNLSVQISAAQDMAAGIKEMREGLRNALPEINANISNLTKNFAKEVEKSAQALEASATHTTNQLDSAAEALADGVEQLQQSMTASFEQFDKSMQQELQRALSLMGQQLASISEKLAEDYGKVADSLGRVR